MELKINKKQKVNKSQYNLIKGRYTDLITIRKQGTEFFIKPLLFLGYKNQIEKQLNNLS